MFSVKSSDNKDLKELLLSLFFNIFYFSERDAGTVLGVNPYKTKRELFYEKTGVQPIKPKDNDTLPLRWGHALEETVAEEFSRQTGLRVYEVKEMYQHPLYPFMLANVDRFIDLPDETTGILECKTANRNGRTAAFRSITNVRSGTTLQL